jgi:hypothetical protein
MRLFSKIPGWLPYSGTRMLSVPYFLIATLKGETRVWIMA